VKTIHAVGCFDYVFFGLNRLKFTQSEHRRVILILQSTLLIRPRHDASQECVLGTLPS